MRWGVGSAGACKLQNFGYCREAVEVLNKDSDRLVLIREQEENNNESGGPGGGGNGDDDEDGGGSGAAVTGGIIAGLLVVVAIGAILYYTAFVRKASWAVSMGLVDAPVDRRGLALGAAAAASRARSSTPNRAGAAGALYAGMMMTEGPGARAAAGAAAPVAIAGGGRLARDARLLASSSSRGAASTSPLVPQGADSRPLRVEPLGGQRADRAHSSLSSALDGGSMMISPMRDPSKAPSPPAGAVSSAPSVQRDPRDSIGSRDDGEDGEDEDSLPPTDDDEDGEQGAPSSLSSGGSTFRNPMRGGSVSGSSGGRGQSSSGPSIAAERWSSIPQRPAVGGGVGRPKRSVFSQLRSGGGRKGGVEMKNPLV